MPVSHEETTSNMYFVHSFVHNVSSLLLRSSGNESFNKMFIVQKLENWGKIENELNS